jgi:hypothetical protein
MVAPAERGIAEVTVTLGIASVVRFSQVVAAKAAECQTSAAAKAAMMREKTVTSNVTVVSNAEAR